MCVSLIHSNATNTALISEFHQNIKSNGASESHQNNCLKINKNAIFLGPNVTFYDICRRQQIMQFLDTKIKSADIDPDKKWITTWNDYLNDIKQNNHCNLVQVGSQR